MKRLLEGSVPPRAAALLRSAASDVPPGAAEEKARLVSVVAGGGAALEPRSRLTHGKWLGALALVVAVSAGVVGSGYLESSSSPVAATAAEDPIEPKAVPTADSMGQAAPTNAPSPAAPKSIGVMDLPSAAVALPPPRVRSPAAASAESIAAATARASDAPSLEDELAAVDQARAAFVGRDPALALARVESYRRRFPVGRFMDEADALEIQALVSLARSDEARVKAARFLAEHPESPYAQRVRSAVNAEK
ncbi:MAG: hypothetical protein KF894_19965 [Labilithrix sp.]|nr:hypothetical protein [Labilithrix sp.]